MKHKQQTVTSVIDAAVETVAATHRRGRTVRGGYRSSKYSKKYPVQYTEAKPYSSTNLPQRLYDIIQLITPANTGLTELNCIRARAMVVVAFMRFPQYKYNLLAECEHKLGLNTILIWADQSEPETWQYLHHILLGTKGY